MDSFSEHSSTSKITSGGTLEPEDCSSSINKPSTGKKDHAESLPREFNTDVISKPAQLTYLPTLFFFYGSLMDPEQLQKVLQLPAPPALRPARVKSYKIMLWGQYPALVNGSTESYVDGMVFMIETEQQQKMLEYYETYVYDVADIRITIEGEDVPGRTFVWDDDLTELEDGTWSLEAWKTGVEEEMESHFRPIED